MEDDENSVAVTHMDIVSWIEGWDLVRPNTINNLDEEESEDNDDQ